MNTEIKELNEKINKESAIIDMLKMEVNKVIIGQKNMTERLLVALLSNGHVLLEGVPGLAKTLAISTLAKTIDAKFNRLQFTPDLLPADIIGTQIYSPKNEKFSIKKGPIFANFILADEINRAPAKVQSALLEAMQERQVTIGGESFKLEKPFLVMATQNPIEQEGTYPLPEAQVDRFMFAINLEYPSFDEEVEVVKQTTSEKQANLDVVFDSNQLIEFQQLIRKTPVADNVVEYAVKLISRSRPGTKYTAELVGQFVEWGAGPRASQNLILAAKTHAVLKGKYTPDIEDVQAVAISVLRHRIIKNYKAAAEGVSIEQIIESLF
jgi:MoxR-like ATPase